MAPTRPTRPLRPALAVLLVALAVAAPGVLAGPLGSAGGDDGQPDVGGEPLPPAAEDEAVAVCPSRCVCAARRVDCSNRRLTDFPDDVPEDVRYLDLSDNHISEVPRFLPAWEHLEALSLAGNRITAFPSRALSGMDKLEMLDLSRNQISSLRYIKANTFIADNKNLQVLNLSGNSLQDLGHGSFQSLSSESLQVLDVSHCAISSIDGSAALEELPRLQVLDVHGNPLARLPVVAPPAGLSLEKLDASDCRLRAVPAAVLDSLPSLTHLAVSRNPDLADFEAPAPATPSPEDPKQLDKLALLSSGAPPWSAALRVLEAEDCAVHELSFLAALPNLTEVRLRGNRVASLEPYALQGNGALLHLDLADNKLEDLPADAFGGTEQLRELDLSGNRLLAVHANTFSAHTALRVLNVSRNPLTSLQLSAPNLRSLDASHCAVGLVPDGVLDGTPLLRHLNLSHNPLADLPDRLASPLGGDAPLLSLDLSFCRLEDLSATALDGLPALQALDLRGNRLTDALAVDAFSENVVLLHVDLDDNPWRCDCRAKGYRDFVDFLLAPPAKENIHALVCHGPEAVAGKTWYDACLGPGAGSLASMDTWMFVVILAVCVVVVAGGVFAARRMTRGKARRRRQQQLQEEEERRACEQEAARRRLHRRMQQQQQEQLRRQSVRASQVSAEDPADHHPPSYEEAVLMDRMTQDEPAEDAVSSDTEDEDLTFTAELHKKVSRVSSSGGVVVDDVIVEEEEEEGAGSGTESAAAPSSGSGVNGGVTVNGGANGSARRLSTKL